MSNFLPLFLKLCGSQEEVARSSEASWFHSFLVVLQKDTSQYLLFMSYS
jgi:hypothetical protein